MSGAFGGRFLPAAEQLGAHAALPKPVSEHRLLDTLRSLME